MVAFAGAGADSTQYTTRLLAAEADAEAEEEAEMEAVKAEGEEDSRDEEADSEEWGVGDGWCDAAPLAPPVAEGGNVPCSANGAAGTKKGGPLGALSAAEEDEAVMAALKEEEEEEVVGAADAMAATLPTVNASDAAEGGGADMT